MSTKTAVNHGAQIAIWCLVALIGLMPFHAFGTTWAGSLFGNRMLWQSWKEIIIVALCLYSAFWLIRDRKLGRYILNYRLNQMILVYAGLHLLISWITKPDASSLLHGLKIDLEFLALFIAAQIVAHRAKKINVEALLSKVIIAGGVIVGLFGVAQAWFLPKDFLLNFGYGPEVISPYLPVGGSSQLFRILATLGGPNQLGQYLILPLMVLGAYTWQTKKWWLMSLSVPMLICQYYSYSRAAWVALIAAVLVLAWKMAGAKTAIISLLVACMLALAGWFGYAQVRHQNTNINYIILHGASSAESISNNDHVKAVKTALTDIAQYPFGKGTGSAGPAVFYRTTNVGIITENYYLQLGIEVGLLGLVLFLAIIVAVAVILWQQPSSHYLATGLVATLAGWSLINLVSHGWADSTAAIVWWGSAGAIIRRSK